MKKNIIIITSLILILSLFYSCETTDLDLQVDPNALAEAEPEFLFNRIQTDYKDITVRINELGSELSRIKHFYNRNYVNELSSELALISNSWTDLYANMIPDIQEIENQNTGEKDLSFIIAVSKILEAHALMLLVDYIGDIPFTDINNPFNLPNPSVDSSQDVYNNALDMLTNSITLLNGIGNEGSVGFLDLFYGDFTNGNVNIAKWIKLANTLKMRADLTLGNYADVMNATNIIENTEDDFEFKYGSTQLNPDTRHPDYEGDYTDNGISGNGTINGFSGYYESNWLMNLMIGDNADGSPDTDPRRRYYFYRQTFASPGSQSRFEDVNGVFGAAGLVYTYTADTDGNALECSEQNIPAHLEFTLDEDFWCTLRNGYMGRTYGDDRGVGPDGFLVTASGVYPAGGSFDGVPDIFPFTGAGEADLPKLNTEFPQTVGLGKGGGGAGINPIILASYVKFWKAEASYMLGDYTTASNLLRDGMTLSINKVMSFSALDPQANLSNAPTPTVVNDFINLIVGSFDNADVTTGLDGAGYPTAKDKLDILGEQFFVTMYGGGADAYNFIRRTGYPRTLARNIGENPGTFPRTMLYPLTETSTNSNIQQKADLSVKTFWDQGVVNPAN